VTFIWPDSQLRSRLEPGNARSGELWPGCRPPGRGVLGNPPVVPAALAKRVITRQRGTSLTIPVCTTDLPATCPVGYVIRAACRPVPGGYRRRGAPPSGAGTGMAAIIASLPSGIGYTLGAGHVRDGREGCDGARVRRFGDRHEQAVPARIYGAHLGRYFL
jgi:hypothetical protein